jgi:exonuclease SbcC
MDDVHVSQFAALLRTLSRDQARQLVVCVHEKPLFEYLRLELSPAFEEERLIAVELGQNDDGDTIATKEIIEWQPDSAVATG